MEAIDVCVCTFRRPSIAETIASVARQQLPAGTRLRLIVADNDEEPAAREMIEQAGRDAGVELHYVHAPARNISIARNACLDAATADWLAFIDDDETAPPDWLARLIARSEGVEVVFGVSEARFVPGTPDWIRQGDFHSNRLSDRDGAHNGYTCNVLIDRRFALRHKIRFDHKLGQIGGEDTLFFREMLDAGARFAYAPDAVVHEPIPAQRSNLAWLARRRYRAGQIHWLLLRRERKSGVAVVPVAAAKLGYCMGRALISLPRPVSSAGHFLRGMLHAGVIASALGAGLYKEYA
jgi:succinoglycan biosynthesis protein ExoM